MSEVIVISDDDLEEGEIADDIEPEIVEEKDKPREKKLPRRYILHENKDLNCKRTKHHKHSSRHRKHHKSCPHHSLDRHKFIEKQLNHKKSVSNHREKQNSHISSNSTTKSAFKNFSSPRREPVTSIKHSNIKLLEKRVNSSQQFFNEKISKELIGKEDTFSNVDIQKKEHSLLKSAESLNDEKPNSVLPKQSSHEPDINSIISIDEESEDEDEEELRRIALSTCLKRSVTGLQQIPDNPVGSFNNEINVNITDKNLCSQISDTVIKSCDKFTSDNYEIVDMELDDSLPEDGAVSKDVCDLFVIDRNPLISESFEPLSGSINLNQSSDVSNKIDSKSSDNKFQFTSRASSQFQSNDDFEEELLRAEVIASMNSAQHKFRKIPEKPLPPVKKESLTQVQLPSSNNIHVTQNKVVKSLSYRKLSAPNFRVMHKRIVNKAKLNYSKLNSNKNVGLPPQRKINACPERIVITLNNDSSTEDSDEECDKNKGIQENIAVASIEALISDARHKSDIQKNNLNSVSWLSKAQQEEYTKLKKILAQNQFPKRPTTNDKRTSQFKMLNKNISVANSNLIKEKTLLSDIEKDLLTKKKEYMASKLKAQHLKEQLHAAELVRAANLEAWKKSAAKLDLQKKSVSKHEAVVDLLKKKLNPKNNLQVRNSVLSPIQRANSPAT